MKFFTSDWHLNEDRLGIFGNADLFYRNNLLLPNKPYRENQMVRAQNELIINNFCSRFKDGDELWHLGDVVYQFEGKLGCEYSDVEYALLQLRNRFPKSRFNLIIGNYDEGKLDILGKYFDNIYDEGQVFIGDSNCFLNHYPIKCKNELEKDSKLSVPCYDFAITGHIHGLWKVQRNMVNVGVDAWHFNPVSEAEIDFCMNACKKFYDNNVFPY